jgi:hypothetical protein
MYLPPGAGTSSKQADYAQGYLSTVAANEARSRYQSLAGDMPWVPTSDSQIGDWAKQQAALFNSGAIQTGINQGEQAMLQNLGLKGGDFFAPLSEGETEEWAKQYIGKNGFPTTPDAGVAMARAFVIANADQIGLPPEFIAASSLVDHFPSSPDGAVSWALTLGSAYLSTYGVPIVSGTDVSSFLSASARFAVAQYAPGVPFGLFEATFEALSDGQLTGDEVKGIVIGAAGYVGAVIGQAFGLPAPIGALLSQLIVGEVISLLSDSFGWGPSATDKLLAAQQAASDAAKAASDKCTDMAIALWLEYQHYWDSIAGGLDASIHDSQEWLFPGGSCSTASGIKLYGKTTLDFVRDAAGNPIPLNPKDLRKGYRAYPYPLTRACGIQTGCPYTSLQTDQVVMRDKYPKTPGELTRIPVISRHAPGCDGTSALAFWGAQRYVTPYAVVLEMQGQHNQWLDAPGGPPSQLTSWNGAAWGSVQRSDDEYLRKIIGLVMTVKFGTEVGPCMTPIWAKFMFKSLEQAASAAALVQRDLARTVSDATTAYGIKYHMEQAAGVEWQAASDAQKRKAAESVSAGTAALRHAVVEARRRGKKRADLLNYGLLAAGGGALLGFGIRKIV